MERNRVEALLVGRDRNRSERFLLIAVGVFLFGLGLWGLLWLVNRFDASLPIDMAWFLWGFAAISVIPAAVHAYRNDGLVVCWVLGAALPLALYLVPTASNAMAPDESVLWGIWAGLQFGIPAGTIGFVLGVGFREILDRIRAGSHATGT